VRNQHLPGIRQAVPPTTRTSLTTAWAPGQPGPAPTRGNEPSSTPPLPHPGPKPSLVSGSELGRPAPQLTDGSAGCACGWHHLVVGGRPYDPELVAHHQLAEAAGCRPHGSQQRKQSRDRTGRGEHGRNDFRAAPVRAAGQGRWPCSREAGFETRPSLSQGFGRTLTASGNRSDRGGGGMAEVLKRFAV
jgi:hypothetical protein